MGTRACGLTGEPHRTKFKDCGQRQGMRILSVNPTPARRWALTPTKPHRSLPGKAQSPVASGGRGGLLLWTARLVTGTGNKGETPCGTSTTVCGAGGWAGARSVSQEQRMQAAGHTPENGLAQDPVLVGPAGLQAHSTAHGPPRVVVRRLVWGSTYPTRCWHAPCGAINCSTFPLLAGQQWVLGVPGILQGRVRTPEHQHGLDGQRLLVRAQPRAELRSRWSQKGKARPEMARRLWRSGRRGGLRPETCCAELPVVPPSSWRGGSASGESVLARLDSGWKTGRPRYS